MSPALRCYTTGRAFAQATRACLPSHALVVFLYPFSDSFRPRDRPARPRRDPQDWNLVFAPLIALGG